MTPDPFATSVTYRLAYALADRLVEPLRGSDRPRTIDAAAVLAEAVRQFGDSEAVREGVMDAIVGRRPRW